MRKAGARTVGQDEQSCVVYGMPRTAFELGAVEKQVSLSSIGQTILDLASARR
jgi:two-component system chemotaxis response regulator CheB